MSKEIEHKYLVDAKAWKKVKQQHFEQTGQNFPSIEIKQGYLSKAPTHKVRIRVVRSTEKYVLGSNQGFITIKGQTKGFTRDEFEYPIPIEDAEEMLKLATGVIEKRRNFIHVEGHLWEVDEINGINKGLVIAEIELTSEDEQFIEPSWIVRDVTHDRRYSSTYLSTHKIVSA